MYSIPFSMLIKLNLDPNTLLRCKLCGSEVLLLCFMGIFFFFYVRYSTLPHLPPLRFHRVGGCYD